MKFPTLRVRLGAACVAAVALIAALAPNAVAPAGAVTGAGVSLCQQYGSSVVPDRYLVQNNRWGSNARQCLRTNRTGFLVTAQDGLKRSNGAPLAYPSIYVGCHYANCSPGTILPRRLSAIRSAPTRISYAYPRGTYDASYDIWLDPSPRRTGVNRQELMIWLNRTGGVQPIGSAKATVKIAGRSWQVWQGSNGGNNVTTYVAPAAITSASFDVKDFVTDLTHRSGVRSSWYLTSVQAGFELWSGGVGGSVTAFSQSINPT